MMPVSTAGPVAVPAALARSIEEFLTEFPRAAIYEDGRLLFDLRLAHCSVSAERGRCLLHLWSDERNLVRRVIGLQPRRNMLRLETLRFGQSKPQMLTLVPDPDFRTPLAKDTARRHYLRKLEEALRAEFPEWNAGGFRSAMDLEHSFGPAYTRGVLRRGQSAWAVLGIGPEEPTAAIEGALTLGILWLAYCREHSGGRCVFRGLRLVVPEGCAAATQARMAWLNPGMAQWELFELSTRTGRLAACPVARDGNLDLQLLHALDTVAILERSAATIGQLRAMLPQELDAQTEIRAKSPTEIAFSLHGLEYARIRHGLAPGSFTRRDEIVFGAGPSETALDGVTEDLFRDLMDRLVQSRDTGAKIRDALYRLQPERWLESVLRRDLSVLDPLLKDAPVYSQVPAFASANRGVLDLLTVNRRGQLVVLEIKADDDLHLPLQALDYWERVRMLNREGALKSHGYFPGVELAPEDPLLFLIAPALHVHPANETVLQHFAEDVPWELMAVGEHWRQKCRVVLRKRSSAASKFG